MRQYDLFISHAWKYNDQYYKLVDLLDDYNYFSFRNYSVPEHDPLDAKVTLKLYQELEEQVRQSTVVLVIGGMYCNYRTWINNEIEMAKKYNKPILLVTPWGQNRIPTKIDAVASKTVGWNSKSIVEAIRDLAN